jgi:hypothetical protein
MEQKQVSSQLYYCVEKEVTDAEIPKFAERACSVLYEDAASKGVGIVGPTEFIYLNVTKDPNKPFQLIIAIPVKERKPPASDFFFLETMPYECVSIDYKGSMINIGTAWEEFVKQVMNQGYRFSNQGREVYKEWISFESEENITELQIGIMGQKII